MTNSSNTESSRDFHPIDEYSKALSAFNSRDENTKVEKDENGATKSTDLIDEYFCFVAAKGCTQLPWSLVKPAFLWKLKTSMDDMHSREAVKQGDEEQRSAFLHSPCFEDQKQFLLDKAEGFVEGPPFTLQRICELITTPNRHYKLSIGRYLRALERNIDVVSEVTESGDRITGAPPKWKPEANEVKSTHHVEQSLIVPLVDREAKEIITVVQPIEGASEDETAMEA